MRKTIVVILFALIFLGCQNEQRYENKPIETPILYSSLNTEGGIAEEFLNYLLTNNYKSAYKMLDSNSKSMYSSPSDLKDSWESLINNNSVYYSEPGIYKDELIEKRFIYCFPSSVGNQRYLIEIVIENYKIQNFFLNHEFQIAEDIIKNLVNEDFDSIDKEILEPNELQDLWKKTLDQNGNYISTNPPYLSSMGDSAIYRFPSNFDNGDLNIDVWIGYYPNPGAVYVEIGST